MPRYGQLVEKPAIFIQNSKKHAKKTTQTPPFKCPNVYMTKHSLVNLHCAKMHSKSHRKQNKCTSISHTLITKTELSKDSLVNLQCAFKTIQNTQSKYAPLWPDPINRREKQDFFKILNGIFLK